MMSRLARRPSMRTCAPSTFPSPTSGSDRKSTRLNSSHLRISYAVLCLKKKNALDRADDDAFALQDRSLLDVQLEIRMARAQDWARGRDVAEALQVLPDRRPVDDRDRVG